MLKLKLLKFLVYAFNLASHSIIDRFPPKGQCLDLLYMCGYYQVGFYNLQTVAVILITQLVCSSGECPHKA